MRTVMLGIVAGTIVLWMPSIGHTDELSPETRKVFEQGQKAIDSGDYDKAIADFTEVIRLKPDLSQAYYNRGVAYRDKGNRDQAIVDFTKAIRLNSVFAEAYTNRGVEYSVKGEFDKAITDHTKAIRSNPR